MELLGTTLGLDPFQQSTHFQQVHKKQSDLGLVAFSLGIWAEGLPLTL